VAQVAASINLCCTFVDNAPWSDAAMLAKSLPREGGVSGLVLPAIERSGPIAAWIIGIPGLSKYWLHHPQRYRLRSPRRFGEIALADRARFIWNSSRSSALATTKA
jgi:hypothetical protein